MRRDRVTKHPTEPRVRAVDTMDRISDAPHSGLHTDDQGNTERGADRLAPPDVARGPGAADLGWHLRLAADRAARAAQYRTDRARGAGCHRRPGNADADDPVSRSLA